MKCAYCVNEALFKCTNSKLLLCPQDVGQHLQKSSLYSVQPLSIPKQQCTSSFIKQELLKRLSQLQLLKKSLLSQTKKLISDIKSLKTKALLHLHHQSSKYLNLLIQSKYSESDMPYLNSLMQADLDVQYPEIELNEKLLNSYDPYKLIKETENNEKNSELKKTLFWKNHILGFLCAALSCDEKILLTGSQDTIVRAWDLETKAQLYMLQGHTNWIRCLVITNSSKYAISGSFDTTIRIWDLDQRSLFGVLKGHCGSVFSVCYIENLSKVVSGGNNSELFIWDFKELNLISKLSPGKNYINCMILMNTQQRLIVGSGQDIEFYSINEPNLIQRWEGHSLNVWCLALNFDESLLVSGSGDNTIGVWDIYSKNKFLMLEGHTSTVTCIIFSKCNNDLIVSGSEDETIRVWNIQSKSQIQVFYGHTHQVSCLLNTSKQILSFSRDSTIGYLNLSLYSFERNTFLRTFRTDSENFVENKNYVAYASGNSAVIWDLFLEKEEKVLVGHLKYVQFVEISNDFWYALTGAMGGENNLTFWDLNMNQKIRNLDGHRGTVYCGAFSEDVLNAVSGSEDTMVNFWDLKNLKKLYEFRGHTDIVYSVKFTKEKQYIVSGGKDKLVIVWDIYNKHQFAKFNAHRQTIWKILITNNNNFIISADLSDGLRVWNILEKRLEFHFKKFDFAKDWLQQKGVSKDSVIKFLT